MIGVAKIYIEPDFATKRSNNKHGTNEFIRI